LAFFQCDQLSDITLPPSVHTIGPYAFRGCHRLTKLSLPGGITHLGPHAFSYCSTLTSIQIPRSLTVIPVGAFEGCTSLSQVKLPSTLTTVSRNAFSYCKALTSIQLHDGSIQEIQERAFAVCTSLQSIQIPPSVQCISSNRVFSSCKSLKVVYISSPRIIRGEGTGGGAITTASSTRKGSASNDEVFPRCNPNLIILSDVATTIQGIPTLSICRIRQCLQDLPLANNNSNNDTILSPTQQLKALHKCLQRHDKHIARRAQQSGLNLLHLLIYFPTTTATTSRSTNPIYEPMKHILTNYPTAASAKDTSGNTPFHHAMVSTKQNMDTKCYDLLVSKSPLTIVHDAIQCQVLSWTEIMELVHYKIQALQMPDEVSSLLPFMMLAVSVQEKDDEEDGRYKLSCIYELLSMQPDVIQMFHVT